MGPDPKSPGDAGLESLIEYIRTDRGFDFTGYKRASLQRRFDKRMQTAGVASYDEYRLYLEQHPDEFIDLFNTILINVTAFFRDAPAWEYVRSDVVPRILKENEGPNPIRIWSTGCASGEEAYSLAICFAEVMSEGDFRDRVKIYATDVDEEALADGRHGIYPAARLETLSPELKDKYFDQIGRAHV